MLALSLPVRASILIADPDPFNLRLLQEACQATGYNVLTAMQRQQVLDVLARESPHLVMVDVGAAVDGIEVVRVLQEDPQLSQIPVLLLTDASNVQLCDEGLRMGAHDYIVKPYRVLEVQQRVRSALQRTAKLQLDPETPAEIFDEITSAGTPQQLRLSLNYEYTRAMRYGHQLSCMILCVSNLSEVAQMSGPEGADEVMLRLSRSLRRNVREVDQVYRSDIDELTAVLPETDSKGALAVRQRIEDEIAEGSFWGSELPVTPKLVIGVASHPEVKASRGSSLLAAASKNAYGKPRMSIVPD